jgi:hypothetical protein
MTAPAAPAPVEPPDTGPVPETPAGPPAQRRLPVTMYILAGLIVIKAVLIGMIVIGVNYEPVMLILRSSATYLLIAPLLVSPMTLAVLGLVGLALAFAAVQLLRRRRSGWLLAMVLTGAFVAVDIYTFLTIGSNHVWMLLNIVTVFYLNQADVRESVGAFRREPDPAPVVYA